MAVSVCRAMLCVALFSMVCGWPGRDTRPSGDNIEFSLRPSNLVVAIDGIDALGAARNQKLGR